MYAVFFIRVFFDFYFVTAVDLSAVFPGLPEVYFYVVVYSHSERKIFC